MSNNWPCLESCLQNKVGKEQMAALISRKRRNHLQKVRRILDVANRDDTIRLVTGREVLLPRTGKTQLST